MIDDGKKKIQITPTLNGGVGTICKNMCARYRTSPNETVYETTSLQKLIAVLKDNPDCTVISHVNYLNAKVIVACILTLRKTNVFLIEHSDVFQELKEKKLKLMAVLLLYFISQFFDIKILSVSAQASERLNRVLGKGVVRRFKNPILSQINFNTNKEKRRFVFISREGKQKQNDHFFQVIRNLSILKVEFDCSIVGLPYTAVPFDIKSLKNIEICEHTPNIFTKIDHASLLVMTSKYEGFPTIIIEALSRGVPFLAYDCLTGPREICRESESGCLIPQGNIEDFTNRLKLHLTNKPIKFDPVKAANYLEGFLI